MDTIQQNTRRGALVTSILGGVVVAAVVYAATTTFAGPRPTELGQLDAATLFDKDPELARGLRTATTGLARSISACFDGTKLGRFPKKEDYFLLLSFQSQGGVARVTEVKPAPAFPRAMFKSESDCVSDSMKRISFKTTRNLSFSVRYPMCIREAN